MTARSEFHLVMVKPSHYDDDGYVIQWRTSAIPSNTLAALNGLALDCRRRKVLGEEVDLVLSTYDETNARVDPEQISNQLPRDPKKSMIALVGVQTNQFPRAVDLSKRFLALGHQVAIGGFHASGCISMLKDVPDDVQEALDLGISIFAGEAEEQRLDEVLQDAQSGSLKPLYNFMSALPDMTGQPTPLLPQQHIQRTAGSHSSFDLGRGCPFQCSFCTIINVQGRKSRFRTADDLEKIIRENVEQGINRFFITDDNFARNRDWESFFDRLIHLRQVEKMNIKFVIQVDTLCHRIKNFIEKAGAAGVTRVFIGLENINPDNLAAAKKKQNRIVEYREMLQAWKAVGATTYAGYILGFPGDTYESIIRDIDIVKRELPLDLLEFFYLTPLPGSEDHKTLLEKGEWMDPDMNKYDLNHRVSKHPTMSNKEWERAYRDAWDHYYSPDHMETVMKRMASIGRSPTNIMFLMLMFAGSVKIEGVHPLESGFLRRKHRRDRRPGLPILPAWKFYPMYAAETVAKQYKWLRMLAKVYPKYRRIKRDPNRKNYTDVAMEPVGDNRLADLEMISQTRGGEEALEKMRRETTEREKIKAKVAAEMS
ncbi:MAG: radical SAM protein [Pseudomonadota bacterium]